MSTGNRILLAAVVLVLGTGGPSAVNVRAADQKKPEPPPSNLAAYLDVRAEKLTASARPPATSAQWQSRREDLRKKYFAILGLDPLPEKTPLCVRTVGEPLDMGRSVFQRVVFESRPKNHVAAHLYLPKDVKSPAPAVIYVPGHGGRDGYHQHLLSYAAHGYVALNLSGLGGDGKRGGGQGCGHKAPYYDDYRWYATGYNPAGAEVWDTIRAVDYLLGLRDEKTGRPLVDPERIGLSGRSGGAARTLWTLAAEPRIHAGVVVEGFTTVAGYRRALPNSCDVHLFYNYYGLEYGDLYGLAAPRPMLVQHGLTDRLYPNSPGVADYLKAIYAACGKPECFDYKEYEQGHADTPALREGEYAWFDRHLGQGRPGVTPIADEPVPETLRDRANVLCFTKPPEDAAHIEQQFTPATPVWEVKDEAGFQRFKQELTGKLRQESLRTALLPFPAELKEEDGRLMLIVDGALRHRAAWFSKPGAKKTVVWLADAGLEKASERSAEFLAAGMNLLIVEPTAFDRTAFAKNERQHLLRLAALVGETLTSLRVRDALGAVRALVASGKAGPQEIYLRGKGDLAVAALAAAIVDEKIAGVFLEDSPDHFASETALFRILRYADVPQCAALLFPRPVYFLGQQAKGFSWTADVYRVLGKPGQCDSSAASPAAAYPTVGKIERLGSRFDQLVPPGAVLEKLAEGFKWAEGPAWVARPDRYLLFSDIPNNAVMKWTNGEGIRLFLKPSGYSGQTSRGGELGSNGLTFDAAGRLVLCQHGDRQIARREPDGRWTTLADRFEGKRFNSPNDLVFKSNGDLYFTDPPYGLPGGPNDPARELDFCGVFRLSATDGKVTLLTKELTRPNGLAFSPNEKTLYVAQSDRQKAVWMAYPVKGNGTLGPGRVFYDATPWTKTLKGLPDGMKVDSQGNLFATGPGGVNVFSPDGTLLGRIDPEVPTANCAFGEDGSVLYVTANQWLCRIKTNTRGNLR